MLIPGIIFTGLLARAVDRASLHAATTASTTCSTGRATRRTAPQPGAASIAFVAVLFLGGSQDVIAGTLNMSIGHVTTILQIAALSPRRSPTS